MEIGVDLIEVKRIKKLIKNKKFLNKIFSKNEIEYCKKRKNFAQHFAVRFAAKEAVWKTLGEKNLFHKDIIVHNEIGGKPKIILPSKFKNLQNKIKISLSHTRDYSIATAIYTK